ncbi:hypothetical protein L7F22_010143 [Adiantum nelumboides]|nr:hypothetical protein [Adiantum nelumboides]
MLPEVQSPCRTVPLHDKVLYTALSLFIFLVCSQLPLYGIAAVTRNSNPGLASSHGTLMELGISPFTTSSLLVQLLTCSKIIHVNHNLTEDRTLLQAVQKLLTIVIIIAQALAYVFSGMYGAVSIGTAILITIQLLVGGIILMCLNELLQKGYGFGSGISLFMATTTCENIMWKAFSPTTIINSTGSSSSVQFEGAVVALLHLLVTRKDKVWALKEAFLRQNLPNLTSLLATVLVFLFVIYFQRFQLLLRMHSKNSRGQQGTYPIKLLYTSSMPIILHSTLVSNLYTI